VPRCARSQHVRCRAATTRACWSCN
jgi:hypothetical protein